MSATDMAQAISAVVVIAIVAVVVGTQRLSPASTLENAVRSNPVVQAASYDAKDDFLVVTIAAPTSGRQAEALACRHVLPAIEDAGGVTLFAIYDEAGRILATWQACE
jgi:hypothetical protein